MRISMGAALAALALFASASVAQAEGAPDPLTTFQQLCVANQAASTTIAAQADAGGWGPAPVDAASSMKIIDPVARMRTVGGVTNVLLLGKLPMPMVKTTSINADVCLVIARPVDAATVGAAAATWIGLTPAKIDAGAGVTAYAFTEDLQGRHALANPDPSDAEAVELVRSGKLRLVFVLVRNDMVIIGYFYPKL